MATLLHDPLTPAEFKALSFDLKQKYEPAPRPSGAGVSMHFPMRYVVVVRRANSEHLEGYFEPNAPNWRTVLKQNAFFFTSEAQADLTARAMASDKGRYGVFDYIVEPSMVFTCPECFIKNREPHKPGCSNTTIR